MRKMHCAGASLALAVLSAQPLQAQQLVHKGERIEVTGSRIPSSDLESASPIAIVTGDDIRVEGYQSLELILNSFPQIVADQGTRRNNGATGTANVDLRGLGRTLVLLNGRRLPPGSPSSLHVDLNQIPIPLLSRVDILTGGASAVYGSDAIAGVVNFILDQRFEGVRGEVTTDFYNHQQKNAVAELLRARNESIPGDKYRDGASTGANLTLGGNFANGKGNATFFVRYLKTDALLQSERDYGVCPLEANSAGFFCGGSFTSYPGLFLDLNSGGAWTAANSSGGVRRWLPATDSYNFAPLNYYQRPIERYGFNAFAHYELSASADAYAEFGFHDDRTVAQLAPSGVFNQVATVRYENPLLSADWRSRLEFRNPDDTPGTGPGTSALVAILRRNVEGGARQDDLRHTSFRQVVGLKGSIAQLWDYDIFLQASKVMYQDGYTQDFSISRTRRALDVVAHPVTGAPVCAAALSGADPSCVPYNIWSIGGVTPAALAYLETPGLKRGFTSQQVLGATITGDLGRYGIRLPGSSGGVEVAVGVERRTEKLDYQPDLQFMTGDLAGQGFATPSVSGSFSVNEFFGEARVPVLESLNLSGSYRYSDYSTGKATNTFGIGFNARPASFVRLRGSYQRAVRAADIFELFTPVSGGTYFLGPDGDPCAGATPVRSLTECQRTGVTAAQYGQIVASPLGYPSLSGGNPDLEPETGKTLTLGVVLMPTSNFSATLDYFDIQLEDAIGSVHPSVTLRECLNSGSAFYCQSITRDPLTGSLWLGTAHVVATPQNNGRHRVSGTDASASYTSRLTENGAIVVNLMGSYLSRWRYEEAPGLGWTDCVGRYGTGPCGVPLPKWRHRLRTTWQTPRNVDFAVTWRYIHSVTKFPEPPSWADRKLHAMSYFDVSADWRIDRRFTLRAGVNNVTDRDPPLMAQINGNTRVQTYDALGRYVFVSLAAKF